MMNGHLKGCLRGRLDGPCSCKQIEERQKELETDLLLEWNDFVSQREEANQDMLFRLWVIKKLSGQ